MNVTAATPIQTKSQAMHMPGAELEPLVSLTMAEWKGQYKPGGRIGGLSKGITPEAVMAALEKDPRTVWTELNTGKRIVIVNGWCLVNREAYYITETPANSMLSDIEINID